MLVVLYFIISQSRRARKIKYMGVALRALRLCEKIKFNNQKDFQSLQEQPMGFQFIVVESAARVISGLTDDD